MSRKSSESSILMKNLSCDNFYRFYKNKVTVGKTIIF